MSKTRRPLLMQQSPGPRPRPSFQWKDVALDPLERVAVRTLAQLVEVGGVVVIAYGGIPVLVQRHGAALLLGVHVTLDPLKVPSLRAVTQLVEVGRVVVIAP